MFKVKLYHYRSYIIKLETMLTCRCSYRKSPSIWMPRTLYVILNWNDCFPRNWCNTGRKVAQNSLRCRTFLITYNCVSSSRSFTKRIFMAAINIFYIFLPSLQQFHSWIWVEDTFCTSIFMLLTYHIFKHDTQLSLSVFSFSLVFFPANGLIFLLSITKRTKNMQAVL